MTFLFGKSPKAPDLPSTASISKPIQQVRDEERRRLKRGANKRTTILTSPVGDTSEAPVKRPTLLGA